LFEKALRIDPTFAPAHAQIALAVMIASGAMDEDDREWAGEFALQHLDKAAALDPNLPELHGGRALLALAQDDAESGIVHAKRALELNPDYVDAMNWLQLAYRGLGHYEESDRILKQMLAIDPLRVITLGNQGDRLAMSGRFAEAHEVADKLSAQSKRHGYGLHMDTSLFLQGNIAEGLYWALKMGEEIGRDYAYSFVWQALLIVHEYDEVRRLFDGAELFIAEMEGRWEEAIRASLEELEQSPDDPIVALSAAYDRYQAGRFEEALPLFEQFFESGPDGRLPDIPRRGPEFERVPVIQLMRLAETRRRVGDEEGARAAAKIARRENAELRAAGMKTNNRDIAEAMLAAFDGDQEAAIMALREAVRNGMRVSFLDESIFDDLQNNPEMIVLAEELDAILEQEHAKVLQLICFQNPTPDAWRPLPATCEDVTDQPGLLEFR
jgi:tetratricopeptide (TPR) repeat protein